MFDLTAIAKVFESLFDLGIQLSTGPGAMDRSPHTARTTTRNNTTYAPL